MPICAASETESLIDVYIYARCSGRSHLFLLHICLLRWMVHNPLLPPHISLHGHSQLLFCCCLFFANEIMAVFIHLWCVFVVPQFANAQLLNPTGPAPMNSIPSWKTKDVGVYLWHVDLLSMVCNSVWCRYVKVSVLRSDMRLQKLFNLREAVLYSGTYRLMSVQVTSFDVQVD